MEGRTAEETMLTLRNIGLDHGEIARYEGIADDRNRIRFLRSQRAQLLREIHTYQQKLDILDSLIYRIRKETEE